MSRLKQLVERIKAAVGVTDTTALNPGVGSGWFRVLESRPGAWQSGVVQSSSREDMLAFSAVYACISLIAGDIAKLRPRLMRRSGAVWEETDSPAFSPVLRKPNSYQTRLQFLHSWVLSKLIFGNTFVIKERDGRGVVVALHVLDPRMVSLKITADGGVYYVLAADRLAQIDESVVIPASEIIHDRGPCLYHPLLGVGPLYACALSATQGRKIQDNSATFFANLSRPSGHLTASGEISDETAMRLKREFETTFSGSGLGRLLVTGDGIKYEPMTIPAEQAQLIQQLGWTGADCARAIGVPAYKVGLGPAPTFNNVAQLDLDYYKHALQSHIESIEVLLDEGLNLPQDMGVEFDLDGLLRMDPLTTAQTLAEGIKAGYLSPNEARRRQQLPPVPGGDSPYLQQQNWSLEQLSKRTAPTDAPPTKDYLVARTSRTEPPRFVTK